VGLPTFRVDVLLQSVKDFRMMRALLRNRVSDFGDFVRLKKQPRVLLSFRRRTTRRAYGCQEQ